jgi:DNA mismatch endonuclease (patch repair protein)
VPATEPGISASRSALMKKVRQRDTAPELVVRRMLHARGWRYRLHAKHLPGTPDIVFPVRRALIFVNGCFWHGHACRLGRPPKSRAEFWEPKLAANRERDARKVRELAAIGWRVMTVWQCSLADPIGTVGEIEIFLRGDGAIAETTATVT